MPNETNHERRNLAYFWSAVAAAMLFYILIRFGHILAILTLVIGLVGGTILGSIFGAYFSVATEKKPVTGQPGTTTMELNATATSTEKPEASGKD